MSIRIVASIAFILLLATLLTITPILEPKWKPAWMGMVIIFWSIHYPEKISLGTAFICGIWVDGLIGTLVGSHALSYIVIAYVTVLTHQRLKMFTWLQLVIFVFVIIGLGQIVLNWTLAYRGGATAGLDYLLPAISSAIVWPLWQYVLTKCHAEQELLNS